MQDKVEPMKTSREQPGMRERIEGLDWEATVLDLDRQGWAVLPKLLTPGECRDVAGLYNEEELFRSKVVMARHGFGKGEYQYFAYPLPDPVGSLRAALYPRLVPVANRWSEAIGALFATRWRTRPSSSAATRPGRPDRPRCSFGMGWRTTTACTRTSTASMSFRCR